MHRVQRPRIVSADDLVLSGCADDGEGGRHLIELSVRLDGVQHILVKLFFRYCAVGAQEGQQVLQEALRGVLRDGKLCGSEINQIGQIAGQKLRVELRDRGGGVFGVRAWACNDLTVLRVVENLDAVRVVFAVEFRNLLAKRLAEVQRRQCQNGLLRQHGCIHGVECVKTVGPVDAFVLRTEQYLQVAVFGNRNVFKVRGVEVAVEKRDDFCFLLRG